MRPFIEIEGLGKKYADNWIIKNLSLKIKEGEVLVLQGPSGIGKSTFLRCLNYLTPFDQGSLRIGLLELKAGMDEKRDHKTILAIRQQLGFVFQAFNLFPHLTSLENLMIGPIKIWNIPAEKAEREARTLLKRVGLISRTHAYPASLSGGEQQRVAIARALMLHPKGILFDEPTSNLDPAMKQEIIQVIEDFATEGLTMVIVSHEPAFLQRLATRFIQFGPQMKISTQTSLLKLSLFDNPPATLSASL